MSATCWSRSGVNKWYEKFSGKLCREPQTHTKTQRSRTESFIIERESPINPETIMIPTAKDERLDSANGMN